MLKIRERMGQEGLTLIELLITIAVLAIVAAIAIPVVTNVVGSTNDRAATQTQSDITDFVEKYKKAGAYTYSDGVFSGYVDLNGDGAASDDEKIEELVVDTGKFTITPDGDTPPSDTAGDFYGTTPNTTFAVEGASGGEAASGPGLESIDYGSLVVLTANYRPEIVTSITGSWSAETPVLYVELGPGEYSWVSVIEADDLRDLYPLDGDPITESVTPEYGHNYTIPAGSIFAAGELVLTQYDANGNVITFSG